MKLFGEMTTQEQENYLLGEVTRVLSQCTFFQDISIEWLSYTHNAVFKLTLGDKTYIMKIDVSDSPYERVKTESVILAYLARHTQLAVSKPLCEADFKDEIGDNECLAFYAVSVEEDGDYADWIPAILDIRIYHNYPSWEYYPQDNAAIYEQIDGEIRNPLGVAVEEIQQIGVFLAQFHKCDALTPSKDPKQKIVKHKLDWESLFGKHGLYHLEDKNSEAFTAQQLSVMDAVAERVKQAMDELGQGENEFGLIHGDLLLKNILFHEGEVRALDFEYCGWGYYLYDLTPLLWQLKPQERYPQLEQALWDGYTSIRPLTTRHRELLETFIAGRQVASMRWIAANQQNPHVVGKVEEILTQRTAELQAFLETGKLNRR